VQEALDLYLAGQLSALEPVRQPGAARGKGPRWAEVPMNGAAQRAALAAPAATPPVQAGVTEL
jgi:hypothetical protein